ncbi:dynamin family protein [bacterium]|nr:dynamin family protein [bacterium]
MTQGDELALLARLAAAADAPELVADATALAERLAEGRFYVACVGQFKRGKSTLLNALVGERLLPAGVVPITTAVTILRWGPATRARVRIDATWEEIDVGGLAAYVSEEQNPANRKRVTLVEVFVPSPLLAGGMCLVDTPGIGSVIGANTDVTRQFVPQIDAALVVLGADPPISGEELGLVAHAAEHVSTLLFVINKADRSSDAERQEAATFARRVLKERLGVAVAAVFNVSALERLERGPTRDWEAFERTLRGLADSAGADFVRAAAARGRARLSERLLRELAEQRDALTRPVEESERRAAALRGCVADATQALNDLGYLFSAEQHRLSQAFGERSAAFLATAAPAAERELDQVIDGLTGRRGAMRERAFEAARDIAERVIKAWLVDCEPAAEALYTQAAQRFTDLANGLLARLAASDEALAGLPRTVSPDLGFRTARRFFQSHLMRYSARPIEQWLRDALRSPAAARRALAEEARGYLGRLLAANAARVANDFDDRVVESRRRLEAEIRGYLQQVSTSAERALQRARARQAEGEHAVRAEVARLDALRQQAEPLVGGGPPAPARDAAAAVAAASDGG